MSNKITAEAAEEYYSKMDAHFRIMHMRLDNFFKQYGWKELFYIILKFQKERAGASAYKLINSTSDEHKRLVTRHVFLENQYDTNATTIAQLREENERYHKALEFIRQEAHASEPYLYSPDVLAFIEKALTPKPPKTNG